MATGMFLPLMIFAQIALLVFFIVVAWRMLRAQERIADALGRMADRRDPGIGPGPTVEGD